MDTRRTRFLAFFAASLAILGSAFSYQYAGSDPPPPELKKGFDAIKIEDARKYLGYLAGPECEGRGSGQPGYQKAAEFVAARFKEYGLKPFGDNGTYFQMVPFNRTRIDPLKSMIQVGDSTVVKGLRASGSADGDLTGDVVFIRAEGQNPKLDSTDNLKGKIVVLSAPTTAKQIRTDLTLSDAAAILTINPKAGPAGRWNARPGAGTRPASSSGGGSFAFALRAELLPDEARALAKAVGAPESITVSLPTAEDSVKLEMGKKPAHVTVRAEWEQIGVPNVVGLLEGTDPNLKAEYVGVGAHLDHMGVNAAGVVYPGADDDGSGSTAMMLVAKAMAESGIKPKRSVVFMAFCGEEMGLIGSRHLASNPMFPLEKMICELQMDMVGRDSDGIQNGDRNRVDKKEENVDTIRLVGSKRISMELHQAILDLNRYVSFRFKYDAEDVYTRSDHYSFASRGVPIAFLFDGFHPDYHQPGDTPDKINYEKLTNAAKLFYLTVAVSVNREKPYVKDVPPGGAGGVPLRPL